MPFTTWLARVRRAIIKPTQPPSGAKRWTVRLLTQAARKERGLKQISRESIRRFLKKRLQTLA
jgi:hypothetical protein